MIFNFFSPYWWWLKRSLSINDSKTTRILNAMIKKRWFRLSEHNIRVRPWKRDRLYVLEDRGETPPHEESAFDSKRSSKVICDSKSKKEASILMIITAAGDWQIIKKGVVSLCPVSLRFTFPLLLIHKIALDGFILHVIGQYFPMSPSIKKHTHNFHFITLTQLIMAVI